MVFRSKLQILYIQELKKSILYIAKANYNHFDIRNVLVKYLIFGEKNLIN